MFPHQAGLCRGRRGRPRGGRGGNGAEEADHAVVVGLVTPSGVSMKKQGGRGCGHNRLGVRDSVIYIPWRAELTRSRKLY